MAYSNPLLHTIAGTTPNRHFKSIYVHDGTDHAFYRGPEVCNNGCICEKPQKFLKRPLQGYQHQTTCESQIIDGIISKPKSNYARKTSGKSNLAIQPLLI